MSCSKCELGITDGVTCMNCQRIYHYGCASIAETTYRRMTKEKKSAWRCSVCRNTDASQSPASPSLAEVLQEIRALRRDLNSMKSQVDETSQGVQDIKNKFDDFDARFKAMNDRVTVVENKVLNLSKVQVDVEKAIDNYDILCEKFNECDQRSRLNNIEISGVAQTKGENLYSIINSLCLKIGVSLRDTDVDTIHRVRRFPVSDELSDKRSMQPSRPPAIVVRLTQRRRKDEILTAARVRRGITSTDIGLPGTISNIFINEHLTPNNKQLLRRARDLKTELNYSFLWVRDGKILMRKNEHSKIIRILNDNVLNNLK